MSETITPSADTPHRKGWVLQPHLETFSGHAGPFYFREKADTPGIGFYAKSHHANLNGVVHGGALLTLADMALWDVCRRQVDGPLRGATVTLNSEFISAGRVGTFIESTGDVIKATGSLLFARGLLTADGVVLLSFSGTLKRFKPS